MQRLPNTPEGETKPIGFRLPPPMLAMIDREVDALRAASPEGASVTRSTALRALLVELEQRRAADPTSTPAPRLSRASLARIVAAVEGAGAERVDDSAEGTLGLLRAHPTGLVVDERNVDAGAAEESAGDALTFLGAGSQKVRLEDRSAQLLLAALAHVTASHRCAFGHTDRIYADGTAPSSAADAEARRAWVVHGRRWETRAPPALNRRLERAAQYCTRATGSGGWQKGDRRPSASKREPEHAGAHGDE